MKFYVLTLAIILACTPALAQRGSHGSRCGERGGQPHYRPDNRPGNRPGNRDRGDRGHDRDGGNRDRGRRENVHQHWDGRRYDHAFFLSYWGMENPFYWNTVDWDGNVFWIYGWGWYVEGDVSVWADDGCYIVEYPQSPTGYAITNPRFPNVFVVVTPSF